MGVSILTRIRSRAMLLIETLLRMIKTLVEIHLFNYCSV